MPGPIVAQFLTLVKSVRSTGDGWTACCPAHKDRSPSLSVSEGDDGRLLATCHANCSFKEILHAVGWEVRDAFPAKVPDYRPPRPSPNGGKVVTRDIEEPADDRRNWPVVATYDYVDANGARVFQVLRKESPVHLEGKKPDKTFTQRRPNGTGWVYNLDGITERPMYRLPETLEDIALGRTVLLVEGEKDAETSRALGFPATAHAGGAKAWREEYARQLRNADIVIVPDNDDPGREWAREAGTELSEQGTRVRMFAVPLHDNGADLTDWVNAGADATKIARAIHRARPWLPGNPIPKPEPPSRFHVYSDTDLESLPPLKFFVDGVFPEESLLCVFGPPGCGKSFLSLDLACSVSSGLNWLGKTTTQGPVLYVAAEGGRGYRKRVMAWKQAKLLEGKSIPVAFVLEPANLHGPEDIEHILRAADSLPFPPSLVVFDTLHRSMTGGDENSAQDIGLVMDRASRLRRELPGSVLFIHHTRKDGDTERGSVSIRGSVDTHAEVRETEDGWRELACVKQKDFDEFEPIKFDIRPYSDSCVIETYDPVRRAKGLTPRQRDVLRTLVTSFAKGTTSAEWQQTASVPPRTFYLARGALVTQGLVSETEKGNSIRYQATESGRIAIASLP